MMMMMIIIINVDHEGGDGDYVDDDDVNGDTRGLC
jgi:hypothetical protein